MNLHESWKEEKRSAYLYGIMALHEKNIRHKKLFSDLKESAEKQAMLWEKKIKAQKGHSLSFSPDLRTRIIVYLVRFMGAENIHFILSAMKIRGMSLFTQIHTEHRHTSLNASSNLRAAVFGMNDGLISNMGLILGMAGANTNYHIIVLAGVSGLLAGACSMGAGEYISVRSQREVFEYQIAIEEQEIKEYPEEEMEELSLIYQARGVPEGEANKLARLMIENPETGLNTLAREELGINPDDLLSPIGAMIASFIAFAIGAFLPLIPFLLIHNTHVLLYSILVTALTLFAVGATLSLFNNRNPILLCFRMLIIGSLAGGLTYFIGKWAGLALH